MNTFLDYAAPIAAAWLILAALGTTGWVFAASRLKRLSQRADVTRRPAYPPPVPRPTTPPLSQAVPSADWFFEIPADCLSDDAIRPLFDSIVDGEFA